jgi:hypothetical protein
VASSGRDGSTWVPARTSWRRSARNYPLAVRIGIGPDASIESVRVSGESQRGPLRRAQAGSRSSIRCRQDSLPELGKLTSAHGAHHKAADAAPRIRPYWRDGAHSNKRTIREPTGSTCLVGTVGLGRVAARRPLPFRWRAASDNSLSSICRVTSPSGPRVRRDPNGRLGNAVRLIRDWHRTVKRWNTPKAFESPAV